MSTLSSSIQRHGMSVNASNRQGSTPSLNVARQMSSPSNKGNVKGSGANSNVIVSNDYDVNELLQNQLNTIKDRAPHVIAVSLQEDIGLHNSSLKTVVVDPTPFRPIHMNAPSYHNGNQAYPENGKYDDIGHIVSRKMANMLDSANTTEIPVVNSPILSIHETNEQNIYIKQVDELKKSIQTKHNIMNTSCNMAPLSTYVTEPPIKYVNFPTPSYYKGQFSVEKKDPKFQMYESYLQEIPYPMRLARTYDVHMNESVTRTMYRGIPKELAHKQHIMDSLYETRVLNIAKLDSLPMSQQFLHTRHALNDSDIHGIYAEAYSRDYTTRETHLNKAYLVPEDTKEKQINVNKSFPVFGATMEDITNLTETSYGRFVDCDSYGKEQLYNATAIDSQLGTNWLFHVIDAMRSSTASEEATSMVHDGPASQAAMLPGTTAFSLPEGMETALRHHSWWYKANVARPEMKHTGDLGYDFQPIVNINIMTELLQLLQAVPVSSMPVEQKAAQILLHHRVPPSPSFFSHSSIYSSYEEAIAGLDIHNPQSPYSYQHLERARVTQHVKYASTEDGVSAWPGIAPLCGPTPYTHDWVVSRAWVILWSMFLGPVEQHSSKVVLEAIKVCSQRGDYHSSIKMINLYRHVRTMHHIQESKNTKKYDDYHLYEPIFQCIGKFTRDAALVEQILKHAQYAYPVCQEYEQVLQDCFTKLHPIDTYIAEVPLHPDEVANRKEVAAAMYEQFGEEVPVVHAQQLHQVKPDDLTKLLENTTNFANLIVKHQVLSREDGLDVWRQKLHTKDTLDLVHQQVSRQKEKKECLVLKKKYMYNASQKNDMNYDGLIYANERAPSQHLYVSALKGMIAYLHDQHGKPMHGYHTSQQESILYDHGLSHKHATKLLRQEREQRTNIVQHTVSEYEAEQARLHILNTYRSIPSDVLAETNFRDLKDTKLTAYTKEELNKNVLKEAKTLHESATYQDASQATNIIDIYHDITEAGLKLPRKSLSPSTIGTHGQAYRQVHNRLSQVYPCLKVEGPQLKPAPSAARAALFILNEAARNFRVYGNPSASMSVLKTSMHPRVVSSASLFNGILQSTLFSSVMQESNVVFQQDDQTGQKYPLDQTYVRQTVSNVQKSQRYKLSYNTLQNFITSLYTAVCTSVLLSSIRPYRSFAQANILPEFSRATAHAELFHFFRGVLVSTDLDKYPLVPVLAHAKLITYSGNDTLKNELETSQKTLYTQYSHFLSNAVLQVACKHSKLYDGTSIKVDMPVQMRAYATTKHICHPKFLEILSQTLLRFGDLKVGLELFKLLRKNEYPISKDYTKTLQRSVGKSQKQENIWILLDDWMNNHGQVRGYHTKQDSTVYPKTDVPDFLTAQYSTDDTPLTSENVTSAVPQKLARYMASQYAYARPRDLTIAFQYAHAKDNQDHFRRLKHQLSILREDYKNKDLNLQTTADLVALEQDITLTIENSTSINDSGVDGSLSLPVPSTLAPLLTFDTVHALYEVTSGSVSMEDSALLPLDLAGLQSLTPSIITTDMWIAMIDAAILCDCHFPDNYNGKDMHFEYISKPHTLPDDLPAILKIQYILASAEYQHSLRLKKLQNQFKFENPLSLESPSVNSTGFVKTNGNNNNPQADTLINNNQTRGYIPIPAVYSLTQLMAIPAAVYTHLFKRLMQHRLDVQLVTFSTFIHDSMQYNTSCVSLLNPAPQKSGYKVADEIKKVNARSYDVHSNQKRTMSTHMVSRTYGLHAGGLYSRMPRQMSTKGSTNSSTASVPNTPVLPSSTEAFFNTDMDVPSFTKEDFDFDKPDDIMAFLFQEEGYANTSAVENINRGQDIYKLNEQTYSVVYPARSSRISMLKSANRNIWESSNSMQDYYSLTKPGNTEERDTVYASIAKKFTYRQIASKLDGLHNSHVVYMDQYQSYQHEKEMEEGFQGQHDGSAHTEYLNRYNLFIGFFIRLCKFYPILRLHPALQHSRHDISRSVYYSDNTVLFPAQIRGKTRLPVYMPTISSAPVTPNTPRMDENLRTTNFLSPSAEDKFSLVKKKYDRTFTRICTKAEERNYTLPMQAPQDSNNTLTEKFFVVPKEEISFLGGVYGNVPIASYANTLVSIYHHPLFRSGQCPITSIDDPSHAILRKHWRSADQELARAFLRNKANSSYGLEYASLLQHARYQLPAAHLVPVMKSMYFLPQLSSILKLLGTFASNHGYSRDPALLTKIVEVITKLYDIENTDAFTQKRLFFERFKVLSKTFSSTDIDTQHALHRVFLKYNVPDHIYLGIKRGFQLDDMHHFEHIDNPREFFKDLLPIAVVAILQSKLKYNTLDVAMDTFEASVAKKGLIY